jgi:hypothetical protein
MAVIAVNWSVFAGIFGAGAALTVLFAYAVARLGQRAGQPHHRATPAAPASRPAMPARTPRVSAPAAVSGAPGPRRAA